MLRFTIPANNLDISSLRLALINYIVSIQKSKIFFIRANESAVQDNIDILKKFAIDTSNIISQNPNSYKAIAANLVKKDLAYLCFCNSNSCNCQNLKPQEIEAKLKSGSNYIIKVKGSKKEISFVDKIEGTIKDYVDSFILIDKNSSPNNIFALAIDDMSIGVRYSINSLSDINNRLREIYIQNLLSYNENITYYHIADIKNSPSVKELLQDGFLPDAIINYLLDLDAKKGIFYLNDAIDFFDIDKLQNKDYIFDINRLKKLNQEHLKRMDSKKLSTIFGFADSDIGNLLKLYLDKVSTIKELDNIIVSIFSPKKCLNDIYKKVAKVIKEAPMINSYIEFKEYILKQVDINEEELSKIIAYLLTGFDNNTKIEEIYKYLKPYLLEVVKCR